MAYLVQIPDTKTCKAFEAEDLQTQIIAAACQVPDFAVNTVRMIHYVPETKYVGVHWKTKQKFKTFILWTWQGKLDDKQLEELHNNPLFIEHFYDDEPIDLTSIWLALPEELSDIEVEEE